MSTYYKIGEIARLYGISTDALRYYEELGILVPRRDDNGYRMYRTEDLWCLNVIRDLRALDFSMEAIRTYIQTRSIHSTLQILDEELSALDLKMAHLTSIKGNLLSRLDTLHRAQELPVGEVVLQTLPARRCHRIETGYQTDEEMDPLIKQLVNFDQEKLYIIGNNQMGSFLNHEAIMAGRYREYDAVFILHPNGEYQISGGEFLSIAYQGSCRQNNIYIPRLLDYARTHQMELCGPFLELLWVDIHTSRHADEQMTELQVKVTPLPQCDPDRRAFIS